MFRIHNRLSISKLVYLKRISVSCLISWWLPNGHSIPWIIYRKCSVQIRRPWTTVGRYHVSIDQSITLENSHEHIFEKNEEKNKKIWKKYEKNTLMSWRLSRKRGWMPNFKPMNLKIQDYRDCLHNFKRPSMHRWQCPIHIGALDTFIWLIMLKILLFSYLFFLQ